ncbi:MAG: hypothetical protein Q4G09_05830 [Clostridia bacterium]|nr:hypothetical protein [Clostridia bacterium]
MEKSTKDNKGITLIALIITVIVISILAAISITAGSNTYNNAKMTKFVTQMQLIQTKVDELVKEKTLEELNSLGEEAPSNKQNILDTACPNQEIGSNQLSDFRYFTSENLHQIFEIEDAKDEVLINFSTREVVSVTGVRYNNTRYYTQYKLPKGQKLIENIPVNRDLDFKIYATMKGLNASLVIAEVKITNGTLSYQEEGAEYWNIITNYTEENVAWYEVLISKSGTYKFKLKDNITGAECDEFTFQSISLVGHEIEDANEVKIELTNIPKSVQGYDEYDYARESFYWAYAEYNDIWYVWIPRFAYRQQEIKFLKGNTNIGTDNISIDNSWTIHEKFTLSNGTKLTGIWVEVNGEKQSGLNMITLLNNAVNTLTEI